MVRMSKKEKLFVLLISLLVSIVAGELLYDSRYGGLYIAAPIVIVVFREYRKMKQKKYEKRFTYQFEEMLECLAAALQTGYSLENAFFETKKQMEFMYGNNIRVIEELDIICRGIKVNIPVEKLIDDMALKINISAVSDYAKLLCVVKKYGGNLIEITKQHINIMRENRMVSDEIETMITGKKYESAAMNIMPVLILLYLKLTSYEMIRPLYSNIIGNVIMTFLFLVYVLTILLSNHITNFGTESLRIKKRKIYKVVSVRTRSFIERILKLVGNSRINVFNEKIVSLYPDMTSGHAIAGVWGEIIKRTMLGVCVGSVVVICSLFFGKEDLALYIISGLAVTFMFPYTMVSEINKKYDIRKQQIEIDYPEIVDKLILYLGAGLSVKACFSRLASEYESKKKRRKREYRYVYEEIVYLVRLLNNGVSEVIAYEKFGKRCGDIQYMRLTTLLTRNLRKGSENMLGKLRLTSIDAFEKHKLVIKKIGEKASSKLLMPMMIQFMIILVIIIYPALSISG